MYYALSHIYVNNRTISVVSTYKLGYTILYLKWNLVVRWWSSFFYVRTVL